MHNRRRYTLDEIKRDAFYQLPKFLFSEEFKSLSSDAKVLYSLLKEMFESRIINDRVNESGDVYLGFSWADMRETLHVSETAVIEAANELKAFNLVEEASHGPVKWTSELIYLAILKPRILRPDDTKRLI